MKSRKKAVRRRQSLGKKTQKKARSQQSKRSRPHVRFLRQNSIIWSLGLLLVILASGLLLFPLQGWSLSEVRGVAPIQNSYMLAFGIHPKSGVDPARFNRHGMNIAGLMNQIRSAVPNFPSLDVFPTRRQRTANNMLLGHPSIAIPRDALVPAAVRNMHMAKVLDAPFLDQPTFELNITEDQALDWFWNEDLSASETGLYNNQALRAR